MFTKDPGHPGNIDSVVAMEGKFKFQPDVKEPELEITMVYMNRESGVTLGCCPVKTSRLSPETIEAFRAFLESAESDFGKVAFEKGQLISFGDRGTEKAESPQGLPAGLGGV